MALAIMGGEGWQRVRIARLVSDPICSSILGFGRQRGKLYKSGNSQTSRDIS